MANANEFSVAAHWAGGANEAELRPWVESLRQKLAAPKVSLGLVFMSPRFFSQAPQILELLRVHGQITLLLGCSSQNLIAQGEELEENAGLALGLYYLPGAELHALHLTQEQVEEASGAAYWHSETGVDTTQSNGWLVFADPFHLDAEAWLRSWNEAYAPLPIVGGLASGSPAEQRTQLYWNGDIFEEGAVAVSFSGEVRLAGIISQGCTPIGETWTITKAERNIIQQIGNRPAYEILVQTFSKLSPEDQKKTRGNLFVGLVINEYLEEFRRGDFLIRNLLGADPQSGVLAVGAFPRPGQTIQFQRRDAAAATDDMAFLLERARKELLESKVFGGCLCSCNGRGQHLFGEPHHDARRVQQVFGPVGVSGFFCNGEIGPIGDRNFLHGYTASLALFVGK